MTIQEAHYQFKLLVNAVDSSGRADFLPNQIDDYLDRGQMKFIKELTPVSEYNQTVQDKLGALVVSSPEKQAVVTPTSLTGGRYEVPLTTSALSYNYHRLLKVQVDMSSGTCSHSKVTALYHQKDDDYTQFTKPSLTWKRVPYFIGESRAGNSTSIYLDTSSLFTVSGVYVSYIRKPERPYLGGYTRIDGKSDTGTGTLYYPVTTLEVGSDYHDEVIRIAAQLALADTSNPQVEIASQLIQTDKQTIN